MIALSSDDGQVWGSGSGTWLGNRQGRARILTAAHVFNRDGTADDYVYRAPGGVALQGTDIAFHPLYNWSNAERTGWGSRGIGSVGQKSWYYTTPGKAAATNKVEEIMDAVRPRPRATMPATGWASRSAARARVPTGSTAL